MKPIIELDEVMSMCKIGLANTVVSRIAIKNK